MTPAPFNDLELHVLAALVAQQTLVIHHQDSDPSIGLLDTHERHGVGEVFDSGCLSPHRSWNR